MLRSSRARLVVLSAALLTTLACTAPPNREIGDAEAALKGAKAAGAEQYAPESYAEAAEAYRLANEAVLAGDYRLALSRALESREHSQSATRESADVHARTRDEVLRSMTDVATLLARAGAELESAERRRVPRPLIREVRDTLALVDADVQKASAAIDQQDFVSAKGTLADVKARLDKALASLTSNRPVQPPKRSRS
jgi:hypothetical protein